MKRMIAFWSGGEGMPSSRAICLEPSMGSKPFPESKPAVWCNKWRTVICRQRGSSCLPGGGPRSPISPIALASSPIARLDELEDHSRGNRLGKAGDAKEGIGLHGFPGPSISQPVPADKHQPAALGHGHGPTRKMVLAHRFAHEPIDRGQFRNRRSRGRSGLSSAAWTTGVPEAMLRKSDVLTSKR